MKKLFLIITFIFACFGFSFKSSASYLPPTLPQTQVVPDFLQSVAQSQIANDTSLFLPKNDFNELNLIVNGRSIADSMQYTYIDNSTILTPLEFYDSNGNIVPQENTYTVYGTSDISPFMFVADKSTGEMLYQSLDNGSHLSSTLVGGSDLSVSFPEFIVRDLGLSSVNNINAILDAVNVAKQDSMIVYGNSLTASDKEFLSDYTFYFKLQTNQGWSVYVPNACSANTVVHPNHSNIYSLHGTYAYNSLFLDPIIYTNDPSEVYFSGSGNGVGLKRESSNIYGYNFAYCSSYKNAFDPLGAGFSIDMELPNSAQYAQYRNLSDNAVYLQPIDDLDNPNEGNIYNYTSIIQNPPSYRQYVNNNYNYEGDTNYNNYPIYYSYEFPTYPNNNEYVTNIYNYYTTPNTSGGSAGSITDPILPENIPILSNLEYRFPFSIPFDLYKLAKGLSVPRETPYIDTVIIIPGINYAWHLEYDLHAFDNVAELFRLLELILFIVALAVFSYDHFFGS